MKKIIFAIVLITSSLVRLNYAQTAENEKPVVMKAVAPTYIPAAALALKAEGKVEVEVKINRKGEVESAKIISGHKLLQGLAERVALQWIFNSSDNLKDRFAKLIFVFHRVSTEKEENTQFLPPYQVELFYYPPEVTINATHDSPSIKIKKILPKVLKYKSPIYPAAAIATLTQGETVVNVKISKDGSVIEAKAESGHTLLQSSAENAAKQWSFSTDKYAEERKAKITFVFNIQNNEDRKNNNRNTTYKFKFKKPYSFELTSIIYPSKNF